MLQRGNREARQDGGVDGDRACHRLPHPRPHHCHHCSGFLHHCVKCLTGFSCTSLKKVINQFVLCTVDVLHAWRRSCDKAGEFLFQQLLSRRRVVEDVVDQRPPVPERGKEWVL